MKDVWKNEQEGKELPTISRDKILVTDKTLIEEFSKLMLDDKNLKKDYIVPGGEEKFVKNTTELHKIFDNIEADASKIYREKWTYYNLEDTNIDDPETLKSAHDFLEGLKKKNADQADIQDELDLNYKPTFQKNTTKVKEEKPKELPKSKLNTNQLSFSDEIL